MHVQTEYQTDDHADTIRHKLAESVRARSAMALREVALWNHASVWVALILSAASCYQAFYAMHAIGMAGEGGADAWIIGGVALALVVSTNTTAARFSSLGFTGRAVALVVLCLLTGFSAVTSGYHIANVMLTAGNDAAQTSPAAIRARSEYRQAVTAREAVERSASLADQQGDT
ncbi:MAG: hypothetical protein AAF471_09565, partial [Myxococcota bacterium]